MAAKYILARSAGFCFGVERSIRMAEEALASGACRCLGELIHNRDAVTALEKKGLSVIEKVSELPCFLIGIRQFLLLPNSTITSSSVMSMITP